MEDVKRISGSKIEEAVTGFLIHFPFFQSLEKGELATISDHIDFIEVEAGSTLFREGDEGGCVYFLVDGEIEVIKETAGGSRLGDSKVVIATLTRGSTPKTPPIACTPIPWDPIACWAESLRLPARRWFGPTSKSPNATSLSKVLSR